MFAVYGTIGLPAQHASLWVTDDILREAAQHELIKGIEVGVDLTSVKTDDLEKHQELQVGET